jgi:hypothetical protein
MGKGLSVAGCQLSGRCAFRSGLIAAPAFP